MRREALAAAALLALTVLAAGYQPDNRPNEEPCRRAGVLWSTSDIVDTEIGRLLTSQPRPPCGAMSDYGAELWRERVDGVLFRDCVIEWRAGGRSDAKGLGLDCHEGRLS